MQNAAAVRALANDNAERSQRYIRTAESRLREAAPLFSLAATMQIEAFQTVRVFTEGASAIQSRNYELAESLCAQPDPSRRDSLAYSSVPEVRRRVLDGQATFDDAFASARATGRLSAHDADDLALAMQEFAATLHRWRKTHFRLAVRMLGERPGTGYTEGTPYLKAAQTIPVFPSLASGDHAGARDLEGETIAPRCPWNGLSGAAHRADAAV